MVGRSFSLTEGAQIDKVGFALQVEVNDNQSADVSTLYDSYNTHGFSFNLFENIKRKKVRDRCDATLNSKMVLLQCISCIQL